MQRTAPGRLNTFLSRGSHSIRTGVRLYVSPLFAVPLLGRYLGGEPPADISSPKDICAKSPITVVETVHRGSLDSARFPRSPRSALSERRFGNFGREPPTPEESFEDVGLNDDDDTKPAPHQTQKKRGFFRFGSDPATETPSLSSQTMSRFLPGRKRGQSGQGSELGAMMSPALERPATATSLQEQEVRS